MATSRVLIAVGAALGLTLVCGIPLFAIGGLRLYANGGTRAVGEWHEDQSVVATASRATEPKPKIGKTRLAVPFENWLQTHPIRLPITDETEVKDLLWDKDRGWCQEVWFRQGEIWSPVDFCVRKGVVRASSNQGEEPPAIDPLPP